MKRKIRIQRCKPANKEAAKWILAITTYRPWLETHIYWNGRIRVWWNSEHIAFKLGKTTNWAGWHEEIKVYEGVLGYHTYI